VSTGRQTRIVAGREHGAEPMRQLAGRIQAAREEERARVARELHDELGQTLTALKLEIGRMAEAIAVQQPQLAVVDRLQSILGLSEIGLAMVKRIATDLRPPALDFLGLEEAIRFEAITFRARTGIRCHLRSGADTTMLSAERRTALFRIFQEALTNIVRHASASAVTVRLSKRGRHLELRIADNGKGISASEARNPGSLGLLGMRERAFLAGATFDITGRRGRGTIITVRTPLPDGRPPRRRVSRNGVNRQRD
jgi:signal transduction histidine kinase